MASSDTTVEKPLWLSIEEKIFALDTLDLAGDNLEAAVQKIAGELDGDGYKVSTLGGNMLELRFALDQAVQVGHPMLKDLNGAIGAYTLEDVEDAYVNVVLPAKIVLYKKYIDEMSFQTDVKIIIRTLLEVFKV